MKRLIDANALKKHVNDHSTHWLNEWDTAGILMAIENAPTVDAVEVVHGRWVKGDMPTYGGYKCSACKNNTLHYKARYCPNCGAKMDG